MTKHRQQQQHKSDHQLSPLLPPSPGPIGLSSLGEQSALTGLCWKTTTLQSRQHVIKQRLRRRCRLAIESKPGAAGHKVDTGLLHTWLSEQRALHRTNTRPTFHSLHIEEHRMGVSGRVKWMGRRC